MKTPMTLERFYKKIEIVPGGCWLWPGSLNNGGYATLTVNKKKIGAHRWAYEHLVGPIPVGLDLDHLCRVRHCVNPAHLEPVTRSENLKRGVGNGLVGLRAAVPVAAVLKLAKTHCKRGHEYNEENTYWYKGWRTCRGCQTIHRHEYEKRLQNG